MIPITTTGEYILQHSCLYHAAHGSEGLWRHSRVARGKVEVLGFAIKSLHERVLLHSSSSFTQPDLQLCAEKPSSPARPSIL